MKNRFFESKRIFLLLIKEPSLKKEKLAILNT